ncbi:MAG: nucleotide disphospho-sugar-binding domain-containing protein [Ruegeria sp.]
MAKRLAIIASGIYSPLSSAVEFAARSRRFGYEIKFFAPSAATELLSYSGLAHQVIPRPKIHTQTPLLPPAKQSERTAEARQARLNSAISKLGVDDLGAQLLDFEPDAIFVDCEMHAHIVVSLSLGIPVVQYSNMFLSPPGLRAPPLHMRAYPGQGLRGSRVAVLLTWALYLVRKTMRIRHNRRKDFGADHPTALAELARRYDVPLDNLKRRVCWQMPWTYRIPTVLFLPQALDLPTRPYPDMTYLGSMILGDRPQRDHDATRVARFCIREPNRKRIFVGFGSMMGPDSQFITNLLDVARHHPEWEFLFAAGKNWDKVQEDTLPSNVGMVDWVPQTEVLHHADLAIMHGGTGGLTEAVEAATPMLIVPHVNDQKGGAARVIFHGLGQACRKTDSAQLIEAKLQYLLNDPAVIRNCRAMQALCQAEATETGIEQYLNRLTTA